MLNNKIYDVAIIGGSYSGLSAAMALGRSLRDVIIIDNQDPCNKQTPHSHNFITQDGRQPAEIARIAKEQVLNYNTINFLNDTAIEISKEKNFIINCENNTVHAKYLILATGVMDLFPNINGFKECWGISVIHCPYCHGYEVKNQKTGILGNGEIAFHYAKLLTNLTREIVIFTNGKAHFTAEQLKKLEQHHIQIIESPIEELQHTEGNLYQVKFNDTTTYPIEVIYSSFGIAQKTDLAKNLDCELTEKGLIKVDEFQKTSQEGIFACGDNSSPFRSVANAVSSGNIAGMFLNNTMIALEF